MPITCICPKCEKVYELADKWDGRVTACVACKQCFKVAEGRGKPVEQKKKADDPGAIDWSLLEADLQKGPNLGAGAAEDNVFGETRLMKGAIRPVRKPGTQPSAAGPAVAQHAVRPIRKDTFHNPVIDDILPHGLNLLGYGGALLAVLLFILNSPHAGDIWWPVTKAVALLAVLYGILVVPMSSLGPYVTAKIFRFELPEGLVYRMFALFAAPVCVGISLDGLGMPELAPIAGLVMIPVGFVLFWLFFHMKFHEAIVGYIFTGIASGIGMFAAFLGFGFVMAIIGAAEAGKQTSGLLPRPEIVEQDRRTPGTWSDRDRPRTAPPPADPNQLTPPENVDPIDYAIEQLTATEATRRRMAARSLETMLVDPLRRDDVVIALEGRLDDPDEMVELAAIEALLSWDEATAVDAMKANVDHETLSLRRQAVEELSKRRMQSVAKQVADLLPRDGHAVVQPLINFGPEVQRWVLPYLSHENTLTRRYAMQVIAEIGTRDALERIEPLADSDDGTTARLARQTMHKLAPDMYDDVTMAIYDLDATRTEDQLAAIGKLLEARPDDRRSMVSPRLLPLVISPNDRVREQAALALGKWHDADAVPALLEHLDERTDSQSARRGAMAALGYIGDPRGAEAVTRWIALETEAAKAALIDMGEVAEPHMIDALKHRDPQANIAAAQVLQEIGTQRSLSALYSASQLRGDEQVRAAAKQAHAAVMERFKAQQDE